MLRLLQSTGKVDVPFKAEGNDFWGNLPPFAPEAFPAGVIYHRTKGEMGHEIGGREATFWIRSVLNFRLARLGRGSTILVNKNPYNTVRLPWIRKLFPHSIIVGMIRRPVPNVFSLLKKYISHEGGGLAPLEGWWGVKPKGWRDLIDDNKVIQCSRQWKAVNEKLWQDRGLLDLIVSYHELCSSPTEVVHRILKIALGPNFNADLVLPQVNCFDSEYERGSRLLSKNKYYRETGSLITPDTESIEMAPLKEDEIEVIMKICGDTAGIMEGSK